MNHALSIFFDGTANILLAYGLQGVVMGGLCGALYLSIRDRKSWEKRYCDVQDKRVMEAAASTTALAASAASINRIADALLKGTSSNQT